MKDKNQILRTIPQVEKLLQQDDIRHFIPEIGRLLVMDIIRQVLAEFRDNVDLGESVTTDSIVPTVIAACSRMKLQKLQRVINGTGVIIHTNLGRSPISGDILRRLAEELSGYCNLELDLTEQQRGSRGCFAESLVCSATGAEDALIVNNNASSVYLVLREFAHEKEVIVSRGELVQIGGGFRLPDIMRQSGATLVEVGTTNITTAEDYRCAMSCNTAMLFSCHQSNYKIEGFTARPSLKELAALKNDSVIFVRDVGSGNLIADERHQLTFEPIVRSEIEQGADIVCFSGDKLLGGCQAGIIAGRKDLIERLKKNPLMRMMRVDKITYYILQETFLAYINSQRDTIMLWNMLLQEGKDCSSRVSRFIKLVKHQDKNIFLKRIHTRAVIGGGAMPGIEIESQGVEFDIPGRTPDDLYRAFTSTPIPIVGLIVNNRFIIDFFTIFNHDLPLLAQSVDEVIMRKERNL